MAVPDNIRSIPRPVNTIVENNGREYPNRYAVRERRSTKYVPIGNPQPQNARSSDISVTADTFLKRKDHPLLARTCSPIAHPHP